MRKQIVSTLKQPRDVVLFNPVCKSKIKFYFNVNSNKEQNKFRINTFETRFNCGVNEVGYRFIQEQ